MPVDQINTNFSLNKLSHFLRSLIDKKSLKAIKVLWSNDSTEHYIRQNQHPFSKVGGQVEWGEKLKWLCDKIKIFSTQFQINYTYLLYS